MNRLVIFSCLFLAIFALPYSQTNPTEPIVGGHDTDISQVPYQVSLRYENSHKCGGSIIGPKHILTAAHCVDGKDPAHFSIRAGSNKHHREGQEVDVASFITHPQYNPFTEDYDAAVLILKKDLTFENGIQIATLANVEPEVGDMVLISGWGSMKKDKGMSENLQSVEVPIISTRLCRQLFDEEEDITNRMFCAGYSTGGKDSCEGDSGGPAVVNGKLAGIVSRGASCNDENYPDVYTNIAKILPWISAQIQ